MPSITLAAVICDADEPCFVNIAKDSESSFTMSPRSLNWPLYFRNLQFKLRIPEMTDTDVHQRSKMDCYLLCLSFQDDVLFALYIGHTIFGLAFLSSLGHDTILSVRKKVVARKHREIHHVQRTRRWFHSSRVKLPLVNMSRCDSLFTCIFLCSFRHRFALVDGAEMANV